MISNLINQLKRNLPENRKVWKAFTFTAIPIICSSLIFALNSFVDNFMSINIAGGNQALSYANAWTEIQLGIISATTIIGAALFSQYVGKGDWFKVKEVINIRVLFNLVMCLIFAIPCAVAPDFMIDVISGFDENISVNIKTQAVEYLRVIVVAWIFNSFSFTVATVLKEKNHGSVTLYASILTVLLNVLLNSIFVYVLNLGIVYLAYSTIISTFVLIAFLMIWVWFRDRRIFCNVFKIFNISSHITKQFFKRIWSFVLFGIGSLFVNLRFLFWNAGYGTGTIGDPAFRLSAATILGITGMFFNIFWTTFESMSATIAVYIGKELGNNQIEQAKKNAKQLQGFHLILGLSIGLVALIFTFLVEHMSFIADGYEKELLDYYKDPTSLGGRDLNEIIRNGRVEFLKNVKWSLFGISIFIPVFVWFVSRSRIISIGGLTNIAALTEVIIEAIHIAFLVVQCYLWNKQFPFVWAYFIFYAIELVIKLIPYEIVYQKVNWARNLTHYNTID